MNRKLFLYLLMAFALVFSVSAVGNVSIIEGSVALAGDPGAVNDSEHVNVSNIGSSALDNIIINATDLTGVFGTIPHSALSFVPSSLNLAAGGSSTVGLVLTVPPQQKAGTYMGFVKATHSTSHNDKATIVATINSKPGYSATADTPSLVQSTSGTLTLNVTNTGNVDITGVTYTITDPLTKGTDTLDVISPSVGSTGVISYNSSKAVTLIFSPSASQPTGAYTGHINLSYAGINQTVPVTVNVEAINKQISGSSSNAAVVVNRPSSSVHSVSAGELVLNNTGNYALTGVTLHSSDFVGPSTIPSSNVVVSDNNFALGIGAGKTISLTPTGMSASLASGTYSGNLVVDYSGTTNLSIPFSIVVSDAQASISLVDIVYPESDRNTNVTQTVTITNTGDFTLSGITLSTDDTDTNITGSVPGSLAVGGSFTVTVSTLVPEDADSGEDNVGNLVFSSTQYTKSVPIKTNARSMLEFDSVKISIGDASWDSVNEGGTADDEARPGDMFAVKVKLENLFDDNSEIDIDDVEVTATFYDAGEDGDDIEGDTSEFDVKAGDKSDEEDIDFDGDDEIDWEASSGNLIMELRAEGEDDNGARHIAYFNFTVEVKRENDAEIVFTRVDAPSEVQCGSSLLIYIDGRSIGDKEDEDAELKIKSSALGINILERFEIGAYDEDDSDCDAIDDGDDGKDCSVFEYRTSVPISSNLAEGDYEIEVELWTDDGDEQTDEETVDVRIDCSGGSSSSGSSSGTSGGSTSGSSSSGTSSGSSSGTSGGSTSGSTSGTTGGSTTTPSSTTSSVEVFYGAGQSATPSRGVMATAPMKIVDTTKKDGFGESAGYLALLSILSVLAIIGIVVLLIYAFTKPAE